MKLNRTVVKTRTASAARGATGIRIENVSFSLEEFHYRTAMKFGGMAVDRATLLNVTCQVRTAAGKKATGFGSMPLSNIWSFPSRTMPYAMTLGAMQTLAARIARITAAYTECSHPIEINFALEPEYLKAAAAVSRELKLDAPIPKLCALVTASPFDAALHDAFGKALGVSCYRTYTRRLMGHDLSRYLNADFKGEPLQKYCRRKPRARVALFHLVGGVDPLTDADLTHRLDDGLPETLPEWIRADGLTHLKIKLQGEDLQWDIDRTIDVDRIARDTRPATNWKFSLDFNERCPNVEYLLEFLRKVRERTPRGFSSILYIEQPTARDLAANRQNVMHAVNKLRPVVIDESLTDLDALLLAREMGYTGIALKACKGQSQAMLMAAAGQKYKMFLCVQDLTCPGASFIHSVGLAAHVPGISCVEGNARQYMPAANQPWERKFPGLFKIKNGHLRTASLNRPGLGAVA